tara:strand:+ start:2248 stop:2673 length:426 start_codon:yes stop_codon:yes gene_type:complete
VVNYIETHTLTITDVKEDVTKDIRDVLRKIELSYEVFSTLDTYIWLASIHKALSKDYISAERLRFQTDILKSILTGFTDGVLRNVGLQEDLFNILFKLTTYQKRRQYDFTPDYVEFDGESYDYDISEEQQQRVDNFNEKHI